MILRLVPHPPLPTILFTIAFPNLPEGVPFPTAWGTQITRAVAEEIDAPPDMHALDKGVSLVSLLESVTFDLASESVQCVWVDGDSDQWPLSLAAVASLESVIRDVQASSVESEREQQQAEQHHVEQRPMEAPPSKPSRPNHKRQRSILMSIVASLVPSSMSISSPTQAQHPHPSKPPPQALHTAGLPASRFLRRRARSTLVDTYRRHVVSELTSRCELPGQAPRPSFMTWMAASMLRRSREQLDMILLSPHPPSSCSSSDDGASIQTPVGSSPPRLPQTQEEYHATYAELRTQVTRLRTLLLRINARARAAKIDEHQAMSILEIKAMRRAWSTRQLVGRAGMSTHELSLGVPVYSSPLRSCKPLSAFPSATPAADDDVFNMHEVSVSLSAVEEESDGDDVLLRPYVPTSVRRARSLHTPAQPPFLIPRSKEAEDLREQKRLDQQRQLGVGRRPPPRHPLRPSKRLPPQEKPLPEVPLPLDVHADDVQQLLHPEWSITTSQEVYVF